MSRLRRPAGRLRDLPIWSKLGLIMLVPTLATILVGTLGLVDHIRQASNAERARTLSVLSQASGGLVEQLQSERAYAVLIATTPAKTPENNQAKAAWRAQWDKVDAAKLPWSQQRAALNDVPAKVNLLLTRLDRNLGDLPRPDPGGQGQPGHHAPGDSRPHLPVRPDHRRPAEPPRRGRPAGVRHHAE